MDNQHRKISGYRELSQAEIDLMNEVKAFGQQLEELCAKVRAHIADQRAAAAGERLPSARAMQTGRLDRAEPERWAALGRTHFQEGLMALTRSIAQPGFF